MNDDEAALLGKTWEFWARPSQRVPSGDWVVWLVLAGRGFGKTRLGAEWLRRRIESGQTKYAIIAGATSGDARDIMVEGESGILACSSPDFMPIYNSSKARLTWPNGARALVLSADEPDRFRGKQSDAFWCDELAAWRYPESWVQLQLGFRLGKKPQGLVTTTPRPIPILRELLKRSDVTITRGTTYENKSNLSKVFLDQVIRQYEGTRLGRQELNAELLDDNPNALWKRDQLEALRVKETPALARIVVGVDPAVTSNEDSDLTGIVVAGVSYDGTGYVLDDVSGIYTPLEWAQKVSEAFKKWNADRVVAEVNNGGDLVEANLRTVDANLPFRAVHASRGKRVRAEPVSALYEQGRVHHVGMFAYLEDQMCDWEPTSTKSPDRVDALVWAITDLVSCGNVLREVPATKVENRESVFGSTYGF